MDILLTVPDLIKAIEPGVGRKLRSNDIFQQIGDCYIKPFGYVGRMPVFTLGQVAPIIATVKRIFEDSEKETK